MSGRELMVGGRPLSALRVVDLKEELDKRGLSKSGSKKDLAERLKVHLQIEKHREGASRDEEQLPNISMQEKLAEQNPFIRDYFASQAELYHSQKVVKKLYEEETRKESEASSASADEGCDSPVKEKKIVSSSERSKVRKLVQQFETQSKEKDEDVQRTSKLAKSEELVKPQEAVSQEPSKVEVGHSERRLTRGRSTEGLRSRESRRVSGDKSPVKEKFPSTKNIVDDSKILSKDMKLREVETLSDVPKDSGKEKPVPKEKLEAKETKEQENVANVALDLSVGDVSKELPKAPVTRQSKSEKSLTKESTLVQPETQELHKKMVGENVVSEESIKNQTVPNTEDPEINAPQLVKVVPHEISSKPSLEPEIETPTMIDNPPAQIKISPAIKQTREEIVYATKSVVRQVYTDKDEVTGMGDQVKSDSVKVAVIQPIQVSKSVEKQVSPSKQKSLEKTTPQVKVREEKDENDKTELEIHANITEIDLDLNMGNKETKVPVLDTRLDGGKSEGATRSTSVISTTRDSTDTSTSKDRKILITTVTKESQESIKHEDKKLKSTESSKELLNVGSTKPTVESLKSEDAKLDKTDHSNLDITVKDLVKSSELGRKSSDPVKDVKLPSETEPSKSSEFPKKNRGSTDVGNTQKDSKLSSQDVQNLEKSCKEDNLSSKETKQPLGSGEKESTSHKEKDAAVSKDKETTSRKEIQMTSQKDKEVTSPKEKETTSPKEKETTSPKEKETTSPKEKELTSPKEKELTSPKEKELTSPKEKEATSPKEKELTSPKEKEATSPKEKEATSQKKEQISSIKQKEVISHKQKEITPNKEKEVSPHKVTEVTSHKEREVTPNKEKEVTSHKEKESLSHKEKHSTSHKEKHSTSHKEKDSISHKEKDSISHKEIDSISHKEKDSISHKEKYSREKDPTSNKEKYSISYKDKDPTSNKEKYSIAHKEKTTSREEKEIISLKGKTTAREAKEIISFKEKTTSRDEKEIISFKEKATPREDKEIISIKEKTTRDKEIISFKEKTTQREEKEIISFKEKTTPREDKEIISSKEKTTPREDKEIISIKEKTPRDKEIISIKEKTTPREEKEASSERKISLNKSPVIVKRKHSLSIQEPVLGVEDKDENDKAELELHVNTAEIIDVEEPSVTIRSSRISTNKLELNNSSSKLAERSRRFQLSRDKFQPQKKQKRSDSSSSSESRSPSMVTTTRQVSVRTEEMDDEALDYGDEEKTKSEPEKFNWSGRILRLKNKQMIRSKERKWRKDTTRKTVIYMDNEYYQTLYADVKPVAVNELKLDDKSPPRVERKIEIIRKISLEDTEEKDVIPTPVIVEDKPITRKVSIVPIVDDSEKELTPSRNPPTQFIIVTNLVRPFTLPQLKDLLQRTGNIVDIWVDKIKSTCIAKFETEEEALETRSALHGVQWPATNSKPLHVDYSTEESFEDYKAKDAGESKPTVEKPKVAINHPVREWDLGKRSRSRSPSRNRRRSRSTSRDRKRVRRSHSPHRRRHSRTPTQDRKGRGADAKDAEPTGKALDELFRKTAATPSIYWLPLTPQQIAEKEDLRRRRMQERERRLAELSKLRPR